jgi:type I restriction enzyme, S subunit
MREDWIEVELGKAFNITYGKGLSTKYLLKEGYPVYGANGVIGYYSDYKYEERQVLISCRGAASGKINISPEKCFITNNSLIVESSSDFISKEYLYFILSGANRSKIVTGSAQPQVTINNANPLIIKLAPLPIQRAIVSKIEALFSDLDNGIANFKKAQEQLKIYRQAVLKKAFEGELTKEWRALRQAQGTPLPTAEELLKQIKEERQNHYNHQIEDWKKAVKEWEKNGKVGKKPNKPRKLKELSSFSEDELNEFVELPKNWIWSKVDKIIDHNPHSIKAGPFGSSLKKSFYVESGYKIYGQEQVISGNHKYGDYYVNEKKYQELFSCAVKPKDALISLVGTVGKVLILPDDCEKGIINPRLIKISFNSFYNPEFFKYYFESAYLKSLYAHKSHGATMNIITLGIIQELPFPLFSLQEQNQIIQEIESRLSVCDKVEQSISENLEKAEALRQSILKKAFEGRLLSEAEVTACKQAADYEPASELLTRIERSRNEKIKAEKLAKEQDLRQAQGNKKKKSTTKKKSKE